jgi:hypothetical protein
MKAIAIFAVLSALLLAEPVPAAPVVDVEFVEPARFTDAAPGGSLAPQSERDETLADLRTHLQALGTKLLKDGDRLLLQVLDVDLAGSFELARSKGRDVRVLRDVAVPRIRLRYELTRGDAQLTGEEHIADLNYLHGPTTCRSEAGLCYEKRMLDEWFARWVSGEVARKLR